MTASATVGPAWRVDLLRGPVLGAAAAVAGVVALQGRDPHAAGSWGWCPVALLTSQPCAGCGGLRAVHDLGRGDLSAALGSNAAVVVLAAGLVVAWVVWTARRLRGRPVAYLTLRPRTVVGLTVAALAFGLVRLLPWFSGLQP